MGAKITTAKAVVDEAALAIITPAAAEISEAHPTIAELAASIDSQEAADQAQRWIDVLADEVKDLEARWGTVTKPLHQAHAAACALAKPAIVPRKEAIQLLKDGIAAWIDRDRKRAEAELAAAAASGSTEAIANVEAPSVPKGLSARIKRSYRIVDAKLVPDKYKMVTINHATLAMDVDAGMEIPGVEVVVETEVRRIGSRGRKGEP